MFTTFSINQTINLLKNGEISSLELINAHIELIEQLDPKLNCFITFTPKSAITKAKSIDDSFINYRKNQSSDVLPPLLGIPIAHKDIFETKGIRTTLGSKLFEKFIPHENSTVVSLLEKAGAISLGKLNMHEIALGVTNVNPYFGTCRNPWDTDRISGGSSGGSAAAVAAGLLMGATGTDTGGSIRIPASLSGTVGLKPTFGRISLNGVMPLSWSLDHAGPLARQVEDIAILLQVIARYDPKDPFSVPKPADNYLKKLGIGISGIRIAVPQDEYLEGISPNVKTAFNQAVSVFSNLGAQIKYTKLDFFTTVPESKTTIILTEAAAIYKDALSEKPEMFGEDINHRLQAGLQTSGIDYANARHFQTLLRHTLKNEFKAFDALLTPTTPITAPLIKKQDAIEQARSLTHFTAPFNLSGFPSISLPCGFSPKGLPIGLQIITKPWTETLLLQIAYAYEQATPWHKQTPIFA